MNVNMVTINKILLLQLILVIGNFARLEAAASPQREFEVQVYPDGSFSIGFRINWIQSECWLKSGPLMVRSNDKVYSSEDGSLTLKPGSFYEVSNIYEAPMRTYAWTWVTADNAVEVYTAIEIHYQFPAHPYPHWYAYGSPNQRILFTLSMNSGLNNTNGSPDGLQASFPSFIPTDSQDSRGWMTYNGVSELASRLLVLSMCQSQVGGNL